MQNLAEFRSKEFDRGASRLKELIWLLVRRVLFDHSVMPWYAARRAALRAFGGEIGAGVVVKPPAKIVLPWRLHVGAYSWIGEEAWIINFAPIHVGRNVCISQRTVLCAGNHD